MRHQRLRGEVEHVDVEIAGTAPQGEREFLAVRGPGGRPVDAGTRGDLAPLTGADQLHVHRRVLGLEGHVGEPLPVGRPGRGHQRPRRLEDAALVGAVRIGHEQLIALRRRLALDRDIGHVGGEGAAHAEDLLVDRIAHAVRGVAQRTGDREEALRGQLHPGQGVHQVEVDLQLAALERA